MFVPLTNHSNYSLQESLLSPADLVRAAKNFHMPALGLTDHYLLTGSVEFVQACREVDIQPIVGLEVDLETGKLALLAESQEGWSNLCRLASTLALRDNPQAPSPIELLESFSKDLVALRRPQASQKPTLLHDLRDIYNGRLYLALQDPAVGLPTANLSRKMSIPMVVAQRTYCLQPEQSPLLRTLSAIRQNVHVDQLPAEGPAPQQVHFASEREMLVRFSSFHSALEKTIEIAERCQFPLRLGETKMPAVSVPEGMTHTAFLRKKAEAGALRIYGQITDEIQARLDHELEIISRMGYEPIFLIVEDVLNFARETNVPYSSRGSAASSLVAYCLGITSPDPLQLNLYFERFLNPARLTPPDIDTDLCSRRRDSVIKHVFDTYGTDRVAMVATINRYRPRSALGDVAKAHGLSPTKVKELTKMLPWYFRATGEDEEAVSPFHELRKDHPAKQYQQIFDDAEAILNLPRHLSVHPGGLVVAPDPITDLVPVMRSGSKGVVITQLDLESVEAIGLVKIDLLGIRGLTVLGDVAEYIQKSKPEDHPTPLSVLDATPAEDTPTADLVEHGGTIGCFQIESPGMRATLREIHARSESDIMAALALYRPGPLTGGLKDAFVRRFKGEEPVEHIHPALAPLLADTFGVILYQEQVLRIANSIAGFSLPEADLLRRAMSHFDPGKRMAGLKQKFIREAESRNGIPVETGERIWEMMAAFAGYGFPKAHAASYAKVAWRSAWCKTHFPTEFMAAVLASGGGYYSQRVYLSEARQLGLEVRPPHINHSQKYFTVGKYLNEGMNAEKKELFMGLDQVKHLSRKTINRIIRLRPYRTLESFLNQVDPHPREAENLARVGAFEGLGLIPAILRRLKNSWQIGQISLFEGEVFEGEDWSLEQKMAAQRQLLGISLEAHPLELLADQIAEIRAVSASDAADFAGQQVRVVGIRHTFRRSRTARGEPMMFLTIEDLSGVLNVIVYPAVYRQAKQLLASDVPMVIKGTVETNRDDEFYLKAESIKILQ
jgi:DNA-directed DNA polymerase III PolC